ncbi:MAG: thioredoxin family protein [Bacilli bacterium]|nr:thioredoxin family protein [Bacilli bacterium]
MKIIKFEAIWCPSCLYVNNQLKQIEKEISDIEIISYDYDNDKDLVNKWDIGEILPVFIFLDDNGNEIKRLIGERNKKQFLEAINSLR